MKNDYQKPDADVIELRFEEHISKGSDAPLPVPSKTSSGPVQTDPAQLCRP